MAVDKSRTKKKDKKNISTGVAHINSSFNNTKILISDAQGNAIAWSPLGQWVLKAHESLLLMLHKWRLKMLVKKLKSMV